jgi:hypothetical protein
MDKSTHQLQRDIPQQPIPATSAKDRLKNAKYLL